MSLPEWVKNGAKAILVIRSGYATERIGVTEVTIKVGKRFVTTVSDKNHAHALRFDTRYVGADGRLTYRPEGYGDTGYELLDPSDIDAMDALKAQYETQSAGEKLVMAARKMTRNDRKTVEALAAACAEWLRVTPV
jgi:hypothetical protein